MKQQVLFSNKWQNHTKGRPKLFYRQNMSLLTHLTFCKTHFLLHVVTQHMSGSFMTILWNHFVFCHTNFYGWKCRHFDPDWNTSTAIEWAVRRFSTDLHDTWWWILWLLIESHQQIKVFAWPVECLDIFSLKGQTIIQTLMVQDDNLLITLMIVWLFLFPHTTVNLTFVTLSESFDCFLLMDGSP